MATGDGATDGGTSGGDVHAAVAAANGLTARWARTWGDGAGSGGSGRGSTVLSGACVWPLLAALAEGAQAEARDELAAAVGPAADRALDAARELLQVLGQSPAVHTALGLWTCAKVEINDQWASRLPRAAHGVLDPDPRRAQAALDAWVEKETDGLLHKMPVSVDRETLLVLAGALAVRTEWEQPFTPARAVGTGAWKGRALAGLRKTVDLSDLRVIAVDTGQVTLATVHGRDEIDVVLALGEPDARPGDVLAAAVSASAPSTGTGTRTGTGSGAGSGAGVQSAAVTLDREQPGPGLTVREVRAFGQTPPAVLNTVAFNVQAHHDLLEHADLFGLAAAADCSRGHFPGVAATPPLCVQRAAQDAMAAFSATGFVAAAVTAVSMVMSAAMTRNTARQLTAAFDRPFGFVAVHRATGLVLVCGWVDEAQAYPR